MKRTVLITGASRGIGRETAILFAKKGFNVVINYSKSELKAKLLASELIAQGLSAVAIKADVANRKQVENMVNIANRLFGNINILINNAGLGDFAFFDESKLERNLQILQSLNGMKYLM